jgi:hypothetical protein
VSVQRLSARKIAWVSGVTGLDVVRGWANGGYDFWFATSEHVHGSINKVSRVWVLIPDFRHLSSCYDGGRNLLVPLPPFGD